MATLLQDLRYAWRLLRKAPGFTAIALITLALGIGINTVMFSILNQVLLRPLPYPASSQLVQIWETDSRLGVTQQVVSPYNALDWRAQSKTFQQIVVYHYDSLVFTGQKDAERLQALLVSGEFFDALRISPFLGRTFLPEDDQPGKDNAAVLSFSTWQKQFASDSTIIGKTLILNDEPYRIIGVMPNGFSFPDPNIDIWITPALDLQRYSRRSRFLFAFGRIKPGLTLKAAQAEMNTIAARLGAEYPANRNAGVRLVPLHDQMVGNVKPALLLLAGAVLLVLLIACANIAGLLLARGLSRQKEIAIRAALGGSRWRLVRQLLTESLLLAFIGGAIGLLLAHWESRILLAHAIRALPLLGKIPIDGEVLVFSLIACTITGIAAGLVPALYALPSDFSLATRESGWSRFRKTGGLHLRRLFVAAEIALALLLSLTAGLLVRGLWRLSHVDPGFDPQGVLGMRFDVPEKKYPDLLQRAMLYQKIVEHLATLPGVESVGATNNLPFSGSRRSSSFEILNRPQPEKAWQADYRTITPGYLETMHMRLLQGRRFTIKDNQDAPGAAIVNTAFVKAFLSDVNALGQRIRSHDKIFEIVGVVDNVKHESLSAEDIPELYLPQLQGNVPASTFIVVRSRLTLDSLIEPVRKAVTGVAPDLPVRDLRSMPARLAQWLAPESLSSMLLSSFAVLALMLTVIGIYGVMAYSVAQRTRELGIRMALGAQRGALLRMVLQQSMTMIIYGIAAGAILAIAGAKALSSLLFGIRMDNPGAVFVGAAALFLVGLCASYIPARRATRLNPVIALRYE